MISMVGRLGERESDCVSAFEEGDGKEEEEEEGKAEMQVSSRSSSSSDEIFR